MIDELKSMLFDSTNHIGLDLMKKAVNDLGEFLGCVECSLWSVNENNHRVKKDLSPFVSTSLIYRKFGNIINKDAIDTLNHREDYAHEIKNSLFEAVIDFVHNDSKDKKDTHHFYRCDKTEAIKRNYRSHEFLEKTELNDFIIIPIVSKTNKDKIIAILEFTFCEKKREDEEWAEITSVLAPFFSSMFFQYSMIHKQNMTTTIIDSYIKNKNNDHVKAFKTFINLFANTICPSQAVSFFICDKERNKYHLVYTSADVETKGLNKDYFELSKEQVEKVTDDNTVLVLNNAREELAYFKSIMFPEMGFTETAMLIPITCQLSRWEKLDGILYFTNKKNVLSEKHIDYFNDLDIEITQFASNYFALIIYNLIYENHVFHISKMFHDLNHYSWAILNSADRIHEKEGDADFINNRLDSYILNIINVANKQRMMIDKQFHETNEIVKSLFFSTRFKYHIVYLADILKQSRQTVLPLAKKYSIPFENIIPDRLLIGNPLPMDIDKNDFITVFSTLFANSIEKHNPKSPESFFIDVNSKVTSNDIIIDVLVHGILIDKKGDLMLLNGHKITNTNEEVSKRNITEATTINQLIEVYDGIIDITNLMNPTIVTIKIPIKLLSYE